MKTVSLRLKLFALSALSILLALAIAGFAIATLFATHVQTNMTKDLSDQFDRLIVLTDPNAEMPALTAPLANPSFSVPYGGFYWQITNPETNDRARSRSMWDGEFTVNDLKYLDGRQHTIRVPDPEGTEAIALFQRLQFELANGSFRTYDIIIAEDLINFDNATHLFDIELFRSLAILALVLTIAAWFQISLGLGPFVAIEREINKIRNGENKRMSNDYPSEILPLITEVNELLDAQEQSIVSARTRASNLAHSLKTHLTILHSEIDDIRQSGLKKNAAMIEKISHEMNDIIDHQLRLSRLKTRSASDYYASPLKISTTKLVNALKSTPDGQKILWNIDIDETIFVNIDTPDLFELLGIILENGAKWARSEVSISASATGDEIYLNISDDGPGLSEEQTQKLGQRGLRLDEKGSGAGIGLSIANEIVAMNRGEISFSSILDKGLTVKIILPASKAVAQ